MVNSFSKESFHHFSVCYEKGLYQPKDFIVHLVGLHDPVFLTEKFAFFEKQVESSPLDYLHFLSFYGKKKRVKNNPYVTSFLENQCPEIIGSTPDTWRGRGDLFFTKGSWSPGKCYTAFFERNYLLYFRGIDSTSSIISDYFRLKKTKQTLKGFTGFEGLAPCWSQKRKNWFFVWMRGISYKNSPSLKGLLKKEIWRSFLHLKIKNGS